MKVLKTAISGLGRIGWGYHLPSIINNTGFKLTAVYDPLPERVQEAHEKYGVKGYNDYEELFANEEIDLMVIASPTIYHVGQAIASFEHGADVFIEKPMAATMDEANLLIDSMHKNNRKLMVYQPQRATSEVQALKSLIEQKLIGNIYMIKYARSDYERRNDWQSLKQFAGGMLNNYGAHQIDLLLSLAASKACNITCRMLKIVSMGDADDVVKAVIETENGTIIDMDINMATAFEFPKWFVLGSLGTIIFNVDENDAGFFTVKYLLENELTELSVNPELAAAGRLYGSVDRLNWHEKRINISEFKAIDFYDKVYEYYALGKEPFVPVCETLEVMRVLGECRRDAGW